MPGKRTDAVLQRLASQYRVGVQVVDELQLVPTLESETSALLSCLCLPLHATVLDPCAGSGGIVRVFEHAGHVVMANDLNASLGWPRSDDALMPLFYGGRQFDYIACSPWFAMLDLFFPLFCMACGVACFVHVPGHYYTDATPYRKSLFESLARAGRLVVLSGLPVGPLGRRCLWLCVFKDSSVKSVVLHHTRLAVHDAGILPVV